MTKQILTNKEIIKQTSKNNNNNKKTTAATNYKNKQEQQQIYKQKTKNKINKNVQTSKQTEYQRLLNEQMKSLKQ